MRKIGGGSVFPIPRLTSEGVGSLLRAARRTPSGSLGRIFLFYVQLLRLLAWIPLTIAGWALLGLRIRQVPVFVSRFDLLAHAIRLAPGQGAWLEFGVFTGESIDFIARRTANEVVGFDSFQGLPGRWTALYSSGSFDLGGRTPQVPKNVRLVKGEFAATLPTFLENAPSLEIGFMHVDCDLYSSTTTVLSLVGKFLRVGSIIVFDEFVTLYPDDEARAFREFLTTCPLQFEYLGSSLDGSVAIRIASR